MRISDDVRRFARAGVGASAEAALTSEEIQAGMEEKAKEFREKGGQFYVPETAKS